MKTRDEMIDALVNDILTWDETTVREWAMQVYESGLEAEDDEAIEAAYHYQIGAHCND
jgi:hypothetical protein